MIRQVKKEDAQAILDIYNYYIENSVITFEEIPLSLMEMEERIQKISAKYPYLVKEEDGEVKGYAYANTWKERSAYKHSAEVSVYIKNGYQGRGWGKELLKSLLKDIYKTDLHVIVSGIALPNEKSIKMCESCGFKKIGQFKEIGFKKDKWIDVGYWELILPLTKNMN